MKLILKTLKILPLLIFMTIIQSCSNDDDTNMPQEKDIVQIAIATPELSSLVVALQVADGNLVTALSGNGPFTVLAPTNTAFQKFLTDNGYANLSDVPKAMLSNILLNHVIAGEVASTNLINAGSGYAKTIATGPQGENLSLYFNADTNVTFNGLSTVTNADISASNGTIHIVDAVIALPTIVDFAVANPALSSLVAALQSADSQSPSPNLIPTLSGNGPFTVFAPTNDAFAALLNELDPSGNTTLADVPAETVEAILKYHVVSGNITSTMIPNGEVQTLGGMVSINAAKLSITDPNNRISNIIPALVDIQAVNGVVHAIDKVVLPKQ